MFQRSVVVLKTKTRRSTLPRDKTKTPETEQRKEKLFTDNGWITQKTVEDEVKDYLVTTGCLKRPKTTGKKEEKKFEEWLDHSDKGRIERGWFGRHHWPSGSSAFYQASVFQPGWSGLGPSSQMIKRWNSISSFNYLFIFYLHRSKGDNQLHHSIILHLLIIFTDDQKVV